jgi:hypothetical protein
MPISVTGVVIVPKLGFIMTRVVLVSVVGCFASFLMPCSSTSPSGFHSYAWLSNLGCCESDPLLVLLPFLVRVHAVVLHGPRLLRRFDDWPQSVVVTDDGECFFPSDDLTAEVDVDELEKRFRVKRMQLWRAHHSHDAKLPDEELLRAQREGIDPYDWGAPKDGAEDVADESSDEDDPVGFGMQDDCAFRAQKYHEAAWMRYEVVRRLRRAILRVLRDLNIQLEDEDCLDRVKEAVIGDEDGAGGSKYNILWSLRRYTNGLIITSEKYEARRVRPRRQDGEVLGADSDGGGDSSSEENEFRV